MAKSIKAEGVIRGPRHHVHGFANAGNYKREVASRWKRWA
jgi:RNA:NAD 2'-phosphotransferase (TPT1/KptA family)